MGFVQIIEFRTEQLAEMQAVAEQWEKATEGKRKSRRRLMCADRDHPGRHMEIIFFDSYDEAMENSRLPEMAEFSVKMMAFADGPPAFHNLDILEERG